MQMRPGVRTKESTACISGLIRYREELLCVKPLCGHFLVCDVTPVMVCVSVAVVKTPNEAANLDRWLRLRSLRSLQGVAGVCTIGSSRESLE